MLLGLDLRSGHNRCRKGLSLKCDRHSALLNQSVHGFLLYEMYSFKRSPTVVRIFPSNRREKTRNMRLNETKEVRQYVHVFNVQFVKGHFDFAHRTIVVFDSLAKCRTSISVFQASSGVTSSYLCGMRNSDYDVFNFDSSPGRGREYWV